LGNSGNAWGAVWKNCHLFYNDVLMPPNWTTIRKVDFKNLKVVLKTGVPAVMEMERKKPRIAEVP